MYQFPNGSPDAANGPVTTTARLMIPREHGAWAMLLLPFVSALVLARRVEWEVAPAAVAVIGVFLIREPMLALWRQVSVWKERRAEADTARRCLLWYLPAIAASAAALLWRLPPWPTLVIGSAAAMLTVTSGYLIVHNRQRSLLLQVSSAAGLNASAIIAWLAVRLQLDTPVICLWALQIRTQHGGAAGCAR